MRSLKLIITGRPTSKKNSRRNYGHISLPSQAYNNFRESALWQLKIYKERFTKPVSIKIIFLQKGEMAQDIDNAFTSVLDVLQDALILKDDKLVRHAEVDLQKGKDWETWITIEDYE